MKSNYWLDPFTGVTRQEFKEAGRKGSGFRDPCWNTIQEVGTHESTKPVG